MPNTVYTKTQLNELLKTELHDVYKRSTTHTSLDKAIHLVKLGADANTTAHRNASYCKSLCLTRTPKRPFFLERMEMLARQSETTLLHEILHYEFIMREAYFYTPHRAPSHLSVIDKLIKHDKVDIDVKNGFGLTPLQCLMDLSAYENKPLTNNITANLALHLVKLGANPNVTDSKGRNLLQLFTDLKLVDATAKLNKLIKAREKNSEKRFSFSSLFHHHKTGSTPVLNNSSGAEASMQLK